MATPERTHTRMPLAKLAQEERWYGATLSDAASLTVRVVHNEESLPAGDHMRGIRHARGSLSAAVSPQAGKEIPGTALVIEVKEL